MVDISPSLLAGITGGVAVSQVWSQTRAEAQPYCPQTVAANPRPPRTRAQAERIGNACLTEMGPLAAGLGGRAQIQSAIDQAFPR